MAGQHGGYRKPANPAAVSGPGALSARTDGAASSTPPISGDGSYGDTADMEALQQGAAMQQSPLTPIGAPSARPGEPITAGADLGAGIGMSAAGIATDDEVSDEQMRPLLRSLMVLAELPGSNVQTRQLARAMKTRLAGG